MIDKLDNLNSDDLNKEILKEFMNLKKLDFKSYLLYLKYEELKKYIKKIDKQ